MRAERSSARRTPARGAGRGRRRAAAAVRAVQWRVALGLIAALGTSGGCGSAEKKPLLRMTSQGETLEQSSLRAALRGDVPRAIVLEEQALAAYRSVDDTAQAAAALNRLGNLRQWSGDAAGARRDYGEALDLARVTGQRGEAAAASNNLGALEEEAGALDRARELYARAEALAREADAQPTLATVLNNRALLAQREGDLDGARRLLEEALAIDRQQASASGQATRLRNLAALERDAGRPAAALQMLSQALQIDQQSENMPAIALDLVASSEARASTGADLATAINERGRALYIHRAIGASTAAAADEAAIADLCRRAAATPGSLGSEAGPPSACAAAARAPAQAPAARSGVPQRRGDR